MSPAQKDTEIGISILKTTEKFRVLLTHFRSNNPKTSFLKVMEKL